MEEQKLTLKELLTIIQNAVDRGVGDYTIKIGDNFLYDDEIGFNYMDKTMTIRGSLYHEDYQKKAQELNKDIEIAINKFYNKDI